MSTSEKQTQQVDEILPGKEDDHDGIIIEMTQDPMESFIFVSLLRASISHWSRLGKKGVWIKLPIELAYLVEPVVKEGFYFHHAEPKYLMLVKWLPSTPNTLPANASHRVGIGAFVMNKKNEVLVVQEKSGKLRGTGVWKFPTGVVDEGEDICVAAIREVKEETGALKSTLNVLKNPFSLCPHRGRFGGVTNNALNRCTFQIDAKFVEILALRQSHKSFFNKSDLFVVCMLEPLSFDINPQESEIEAAQWMPYEEYAAQSFVRNNELLHYISEISLAKWDGQYAGFTPETTLNSFSGDKGYLYFNRQGLNRPHISYQLK